LTAHTPIFLVGNLERNFVVFLLFFVFVLIRESFFLQYLKGKKNGAFTFYNYHFKICRMVSLKKSKNTTTKFLSRFPTKKIGVWAVNSVSHVTVYN
jgi:hypothetical protein